MISYPSFDPIAFSIGPIHVYWYGMMYLLGFIMAWWLAQWRNKHYQLGWTKDDIGDVLFYAALGVIIGGRLGYILIYDTLSIQLDPLRVLRVWEGGMSFHGGLLGVVVATYVFAKRVRRPFWRVADFLVPLVPVGLGLGRLGNFINGELWGRVTDVPWAMIFPRAGIEPRHPSQLYEFCFEGIFLFALIWWYARRSRAPGSVTAVFLMGYGVCRFLVEFFREPDIQIGFVAFDWLTMGQLLSILMLALGMFLFVYAHRLSSPLKKI